MIRALGIRLVRRRILELVFGVDPKADEIVAKANKSRQDGEAGRRERIKEGAADTGWPPNLIGSYQCEQLGPARIFQESGTYQVEFESWSSTLGLEIQPSGDRLIALTSAPLSGSLKFQVTAEADLLLDAGRIRTFFGAAEAVALAISFLYSLVS